MSEEQASIAQHTLSLLRKVDTKLDDVLLRLTALATPTSPWDAVPSSEQ